MTATSLKAIFSIKMAYNLVFKGNIYIYLFYFRKPKIFVCVCVYLYLCLLLIFVFCRYSREASVPRTQVITLCAFLTGMPKEVPFFSLWVLKGFQLMKFVG